MYRFSLKMSLFLAAMLVSFVAPANSIWDSPTVWETASFAKSTVKGTVKTIAHDDARDRILVRVKTNAGFKTLKICYQGVQNASLQANAGFVAENPHLEIITSAMDEGKRVSLTYGGTWDRCIKSVKVEVVSRSRKSKSAKSHQTNREASEQEPGFVEI